MDTKIENTYEKWDAIRREYDAKADRLAAETRLKYNQAFDDFEEEVNATTDWTAAAWNEFTAKVDRKWQEFALSLQDED